MSSSGKLAGKVAVVTGGSRGIGAAIARQLAAAGATVAVNYSTSRSAAEAVVEEANRSGGDAWAVGGDFGNSDEIARVFAEVKQRCGKLDVLVNNAAAFKHLPLEETTPQEFHRIFNLNVLGLLLATKEAVPLMADAGGSVINIGAISGQMGGAGISMFSASKGALNTITVSLSKELGPRNIRVNALNPGMTKTDGFAAGAMGAAFEAQAIKMTPLGRMGQPNDIATVAAFLASDDAYWVTGQLINLSGGLTY